MSHLLPRRNFLGLGLGGIVTALTGIDAAANARPAGRAKQVLVIFEQGGVSHIDTWDPKPDAPLEHRSPFKPVRTSASGVLFTELLTHTARVANRLTVVR